MLIYRLRADQNKMMQVLDANKKKLRKSWTVVNVEIEQESSRWKSYLLGIDPVDINRGGDYLFPRSNAASIMSNEKRP